MNKSSPVSTSPKMFERPRLPAAMVYLVLLLIFTQVCALLMNQPAAFWQDPQYASVNLPFRSLLLGGPLLFLGIAALYQLGVWLLLRRLSVPAGTFLTAALAISHSIALFRTTLCGFHPIYELHSREGCSAFPAVPPALFFLIFGLILFGNHLPERWVKQVKRPAIILSAAWVLLMGSGVYRAAFPPASPWSPLAPEHSPGPRSMAAIAYDTSRQRAVLFGGISHWNGREWVYDNSTWEWDGRDWKRIETVAAPTGRILHAMAYDEVNEKVILYGGQNTSGSLADLWEWDGETWRRLCPVCNPAARSGHRMVFDTVRQRIVIYGGWSEDKGYSEGWTWDGREWSYIQFDDSVPALYNAPMIHDPGGDRMVSFMGDVWGGTWVWEAAKWYKTDPKNEPPLRDQATLTFDPVNEHAVLFGGGIGENVLYDDTWILIGEDWMELNTPIAPPQRIRAVSFYDPVRNSVIIYGGAWLNSIHGDMWEFKSTRGDLP